MALESTLYWRVYDPLARIFVHHSQKGAFLLPEPIPFLDFSDLELYLNLNFRREKIEPQIFLICIKISPIMRIWVGAIVPTWHTKPLLSVSTTCISRYWSRESDFQLSQASFPSSSSSFFFSFRFTESFRIFFSSISIIWRRRSRS